MSELDSITTSLTIENCSNKPMLIPTDDIPMASPILELSIFESWLVDDSGHLSHGENAIPSIRTGGGPENAHYMTLLPNKKHRYVFRIADYVYNSKIHQVHGAKAWAYHIEAYLKIPLNQGVDGYYRCKCIPQKIYFRLNK